MDSYKRRQEGGQGPFAGPPGAGTSGNGLGASQSGGGAGFGGIHKRQRLGPPGQGREGELGVGEGPGRLLPVCLLVSENTAGALIGKGGSTVREFEQSTNARILVQRNTLGPHELAAAKHAAAETAGASPVQGIVDVEKVVAVAAQKEEELDAGVRRVLNLIATHPSHSGRLAALLLVPQRSVGGIVGQRGKTVEELSQRSQAQIRVVPGIAAPNGDRALCISGSSEDHVAQAIQLIQQHLQQMLVAGRLGSQDVDFLISLASIPQPKALRGVKPQGPPGASPLPGGMPVGGPGMMGAGYYGGPGAGWGSGAPAGALPGGPQPGPQVGPGGPGRAIPLSSSRFVASAETCGGAGCSSVLCLIIPQRLAAWVVGPQGAHVRSVREETGAQLQVVDEVLGFTAEDARRVARGPQGVGSNAETSDSTDRFCMVSGGVQSLCASILRLCVPLHEKLQQLRQPLRLLIPARFVTCLIGSKGSVIREMQNTSGATIQISKGGGGPDGGGNTWGDQGSGARGNAAAGSSRDQHRIVFIEGPLAPRLVALALVWQRILGVEYPELARGGAPFICVSSLAEDLQQQGHDVSMIRLPPAPVVLPPMQQQPPYGGEESGAPYYDGSAVAGSPGWGAPQHEPMAVGGGGGPWGGDEGAWGQQKEGPPTFEQMEACFREFCSRFLAPQELAACGERQTIKLLLSQTQGEALLRREQVNPRYGGAANSQAPNALDKISELTGCHVRCFVTQEPVAQGGPGAGPPQQQMVLVFTGSPVANSLAVMLTQARLI